jgi:hypothetical protein
MAFQNASFFLVLCVFTLVGFILRSLTNRTSEVVPQTHGLKLKTQSIVIVLTMALWLVLIFFK